MALLRRFQSEKMDQSVKCLLRKHEDLSSNPQPSHNKRLYMPIILVLGKKTGTIWGTNYLWLMNSRFSERPCPKRAMEGDPRHLPLVSTNTCAQMCAYMCIRDHFHTCIQNTHSYTQRDILTLECYKSNAYQTEVDFGF
jgi:hypothetical protein